MFKPRNEISVNTALKKGIIHRATRWSYVKKAEVANGFEVYCPDGNGIRMFERGSDAVAFYLAERDRINSAPVSKIALPKEIQPESPSELHVRKALRKLRTLIGKPEFESLYSEVEIDAFFDILRHMLPNYRRIA